MAIMEISVVPLGTQNASVSKYVAGALNVIEGNSRIKYRLTPMGTVIEADSPSELLDAALKMHESVFDKGAQRVVTSIRLDDRRDKSISLESKLKSVESQRG